MDASGRALLDRTVAMAQARTAEILDAVDGALRDLELLSTDLQELADHLNDLRGREVRLRTCGICGEGADAPQHRDPTGWAKGSHPFITEVHR